MIITDFNNWVGYQFGNKLLGLNNLIQISNFYNQDYYFTHFNGLELFDINHKIKDYNSIKYEILNIELLVKNKNDIILDNNKIYYLEPCLIELFHEFDSISTFDIFKYKDSLHNNKKIIGIHYRGTDFKVWDDKCILPFEYYKNSIDFIIETVKDEYIFMLFSDDYTLDSYNKSIEYLKSLNIQYQTGNIHNYLSDFKNLSFCDYIISSPSTFCITAAFCGKKDKKIIHSYDFIMNYKKNSDYFRDIFWKNLIDKNQNNDYILYKLI